MKNTGLLGVLTVTLIIGLAFTGCDSGTGGGEDITWTLTQIGGALDEGGIPSGSTTAIGIDFSKTVNDLTEYDLYVSGPFGSWTLTGSGTAWQINITGGPDTSENVSVYIDREGIEPGPKYIMVYKEGTALPVDYTVTANGDSNTDSTKITFTFTEAVSGLTYYDIIINEDTGEISIDWGTLAGSNGNKTWTVDITVFKQGIIGIGIDKDGVTSTYKELQVYKKPVAGAKSITITGLPAKFGDAEIYVALFANADVTVDSEPQANGENSVSGNRVTVDLYDSVSRQPWTGSGSWYAVLSFDYLDSETGDWKTEIYISTSSISFSSNNVSRAFSGFKKMAFPYTIADFADISGDFYGMTVSPPSSTTTLGEWLSSEFDEYSDIYRAIFSWFTNNAYTSDTLTTKFTTNTSINADTVFYVDMPLEDTFGGDSEEISPPPFDYNPVSVSLLASDTWTDGNLSSSTDVKWYSISVTDETTYYIWWDDYDTYDAHEDVMVCAYYSDGTLIFNTDRGDFYYPSDRGNYKYFIAPTSDTVYIAVYPLGYGGSFGGTFKIAYNATGIMPALP
jgi:hypothetical protein